MSAHFIFSPPPRFKTGVLPPAWLGRWVVWKCRNTCAWQIHSLLWGQGTPHTKISSHSGRCNSVYCSHGSRSKAARDSSVKEKSFSTQWPIHWILSVIRSSQPIESCCGPDRRQQWLTNTVLISKRANLLSSRDRVPRQTILSPCQMVQARWCGLVHVRWESYRNWILICHCLVWNPPASHLDIPISPCLNSTLPVSLTTLHILYRYHVLDYNSSRDQATSKQTQIFYHRCRSTSGSINLPSTIKVLRGSWFADGLYKADVGVFALSYSLLSGRLGNISVAVGVSHHRSRHSGGCQD